MLDFRVPATGVRFDSTVEQVFLATVPLRHRIEYVRLALAGGWFGGDIGHRYREEVDEGPHRG
jgi:hypothetical protein